MAKSLKQLIDDRNDLIAKDRALLEATDDGKSASDRAAESDRIYRDVEALDKEIDALRDLDTRRERAEKYKAIQNEPPKRQTDPREPAKIPDKLAERLSLKFGKSEFDVDRDSQLALRSSKEYLANFDKYLMGGRAESLGLVVGKDDKGGYLAPTVMAQQLIKFVDDEVFIRRYATIFNIEGNDSLGAVSYDSDPGNADWTAEVPASDISEDDSITLGKRELKPHLLTKLLKVSQKFLRTAGMLPGGASNYLGGRLGYKFAITEESNFLSGDGAQKPLGLFTASNDGVPTTRDTTCASQTVFTADEVINALYALKPQYQNRCVGLFSREFVKRARKLKDGTGAYIWGAGLMSGQPDMICNRPYIQSENVPSTFTAGLYVGMWADLSHYWIADSLGLTIQRLDELFQLKNQVGFIARKETDAMPVLAEAFSRIKLAP